MSKNNEDLDMRPEGSSKEHENESGIVDRLWNIFSSMKLGLFLLIVIAVTSIIGTIIPQKRAPQDYGDLYPLYSALGITDMYASWWFVTLLFLLAMNLFICSFNRMTPLWRLFSQPKAKVSENYLTRLDHHIIHDAQKSQDNMAQQVKENWQSRGYRVVEEKVDGKIFVHGDKGRYGIWGSFITHISLLVILIGAVIGIYFGTEGRIAAEVGRTFSLNEVYQLTPDEDFKVRVDDFKTIYREDGSVDAWISTLTVIDEGQEVLTEEIRVNHPLNYKGYKFYQSFYGSYIPTQVSSPGAPEGLEITITERDFVPVPGTNLGVWVAQYIPDFDPNLGWVSKSPDPNNPRIIYVLYRGNQQIGIGAAKIGEPEILADGEGAITFQDYQPYTGLSVRKDPGVWTVWIGSGLMILGLGLSFYLPHRRLWAIVEDNNGKAQVRIGGHAQKNKIAFEKEFEEITAPYQHKTEGRGTS
ncbi:cytochrome c biogenesis protein ResB [Heliorestis acidaminivorans]|uniref:Cytochrome c biogenesis protein ResB n=1 Tax=Heliorestis acidaminivorans TaxID=553427 RepID=A0A6I0F6K0_9FIRM|nr:cytochrome c biogenesis protein ResB [Heliorestis acidaminivorans]KAB2954602.1 cytochrome c biogenesis protein ResB [Heliorestis acidaminivorans]